MNKITSKSRFETELLQATQTNKECSWLFLNLPKAVSEKLPRRGRTTVEGTLNDYSFQATLDPDGQLSHWLKVDKTLQEAAGVKKGDIVSLEISPVGKEPEPKVPDDFQLALNSNPDAMQIWDDTTTIARIDWIHWIESAKQSKTRKSRIENGCDMLASGKKRVCCFDQSGFYSKSLGAPEILTPSQ